MDEYGAWLRQYFGYLALMTLFCVCVALPWSALWLYQSGDAAVERVVAAQARGDFALFGSALSQDFADYKLRLYDAVKPEIAAVGSSRVMQFRGDWFKRPFVNMGGAAGNLSLLRSTLRAMLAAHKPGAVIIGLDFWWFMPQWEALPFQDNAPTTGSYNYGPESLKKPWRWLWSGKISLAEFFAPALGIFGRGFRADRFGIMAQRTDDGFGPDGSWYHTAEITGLRPPADFQFTDTLCQVRRGIKAFYHAGDSSGPNPEHIGALAAICGLLRDQGVPAYIFIAPLAPRVWTEMLALRKAYPHLFNLRAALLAHGIQVLDFSDPQSLSSPDAEFLDGFHGGEVTYARILLRMARHWPGLAPYVDAELLESLISRWQGRTLVPDARLTGRPETDFMNWGGKNLNRH